MYHIFFIHSSVNGYLDCFQVLAIENSAAKNMGMHVSFRTMVLKKCNINMGTIFIFTINTVS